MTHNVTNNITNSVTKYNSKLLKLTESMILNKEVKTTIEFAKQFMFTFDSKEPFPIDINVLIDIKVYDRKDNAKRKLIKIFIT